MENENTGLIIPEFVYSKEKQKEYERSFRLANIDPEMMDLAEGGLDDFAGIIERFESKCIK